MNKLLTVLGIVLAILLFSPVDMQAQTTVMVVPSCANTNQTLTVGQMVLFLTVDATGNLCIGGSQVGKPIPSAVTVVAGQDQGGNTTVLSTPSGVLQVQTVAKLLPRCNALLKTNCQ